MEPVNKLTSPLALEADEQFMKPVNDLTSTFDLYCGYFMDTCLIF